MERVTLSFRKVESLRTSTPEKYKKIIRNDLKRLKITLPKSILETDKLVVFLGIHGSLNETTEMNMMQQHLIHQWQVKTVAQCFVDLARSKVPAFDRREPNADRDVTMFGDLHDIGRAWSQGESHPLVGRIVIEELGLQDKYARFAEDHHGWGLRGEIGNRHRQAILAGEGPQYFDVMYEKLKTEYGLAGLATLVADNSKKFSEEPQNEYDKFVPEITEFTEDLGSDLLEIQYQKGRLARGSEEDQIEQVGVKYLLHIIERINKDYGVNYQEVIDKARKNWPANFIELQEMWSEIKNSEFESN